MSYKDPLIVMHREEILKLAAQYHIKNLRLFGSRARGDARPDSDVDLLAYVRDSEFMEMVDFWDKAEGLLGVKVDLVSENALSPYIGPYILKEARPL